MTGQGQSDNQTSEKSPQRPGLVTTSLTAPFWAQASQGKLLFQQCTSCGNRQHYPRNLCTQCWSEELEWVTAQGHGVVWTFTVVSIPGHPAWADETPYTIALVQLEEGPRVMTRIVDCPPGQVFIGMAVRLQPTWDQQIQQTLLNFAPVNSASMLPTQDR